MHPVEGEESLPNEVAEAWRMQALERVDDIKAAMGAKNIPVIAGYVRDDHMSLIWVDALDRDTLKVASDGSSLCVIDLRMDDDLSAEPAAFLELHVYVRLGTTETWLYWRSRAADEIEEDAESTSESAVWPFGAQPAQLTIDKATIQALSVKVAKAQGFGSMRKISERMEFAANLFATERAVPLEAQDLDSIARSAESFYSLGVAPKLVQDLERQGKKLSEIARTLGLARERVERLMGVKVPPHIAKLLEEE